MSELTRKDIVLYTRYRVDFYADTFRTGVLWIPKEDEQRLPPCEQGLRTMYVQKAIFSTLKNQQDLEGDIQLRDIVIILCRKEASDE